ncbi:MAG: DUF4124 domain-containing protein [Gammaproteobacteria bacterium]|nr:DUF4124 domain-containing protein [Gammaproteobacteria bacterium]
MLSFALFILATPCSAEIYKSVDDEGNVTYGDRPTANQESQIVKPLPISTYSSTYRPPNKQTVSNQENNNKKTKTINYTQLLITQPQDDTALRSNSGQVTIITKTTPPLDTKAGHKIEITLDGERTATSDNGMVILEGLSRGTHSLSATIIDENGKVLATSANQTFHLLRSSAQ